MEPPFASLWTGWDCRAGCFWSRSPGIRRPPIECNYNSIPFDPRKPFDPSGLRIGTPLITSRGMRDKDMEPVAEWIDRALKVAGDQAKLHAIRAEIAEFCKAFPAPGRRV